MSERARYCIAIDDITALGVEDLCYSGKLKRYGKEWASCTGSSVLSVLDMLTAEIVRIEEVSDD